MDKSLVNYSVKNSHMVDIAFKDFPANATWWKRMKLFQSIMLISFLVLTGFWEQGSLGDNSLSNYARLHSLVGNDRHPRVIRTVESERSSRAVDGNAMDDMPNLELIERMQNETYFSGETATLRCKVSGSSSTNITFTWFKDNVLVEDGFQNRVKIKRRSWGSRLVVEGLFTSDSGRYRCEASNGYRRVYTSAYLHVSFNRPPPVEEDDKVLDAIKGNCEKYSGFACKKYLGEKAVYVEAFQIQSEMETQIKSALSIISNIEGVSSECQRYARKAFCYFVFPPCAAKENGTSVGDPYPLSLCRSDCHLLKHNVCQSIFFESKSSDSSSLISDIVNSADCELLPPTTSAVPQCTSIGLPSVVNRHHKCYNDSGESYRGTLSVASSGETCQPWPSAMLFKYPELSGGHNFCRNPGEQKSIPWCYVDNDLKKKEVCQVPFCDFSQDGKPDLIMILIPTVSVPLLLGCFVLVFCFACRNRKTKNPSHTKGIRMDSKPLSSKKAKVPELSANVVHVIGELGDGKFGKVYKAHVLSNLHYCPNEPVAVKTLTDRATSAHVQEFQKEMEMFSELQHANIAALKAVVIQPTLRCMIFEYTNSVDLHEYLVLHSPQADFAKPPSSASSHTSSTIDHADFIRMAMQVASGMEYLSCHNFIHRDLAARNILVCGNMELKICNLGVVRDSHLSSYYRSPQGGQMLPIRWMAPESLRCWQFTDKTAVWSFGVLLWEMFSYGLQPYCGYSNHEVLDIITRHQLLTCPDQCSAKVYSLMHECWSSQPANRPQFKDVHAKLVGWDGTNTARMTSQLAQGIHCQLTNVMREGESNQYIQHGQPATMVNNAHVQYSATPATGYIAMSPPGAPHTSPTSRLYHSPGGLTSASSGNSGNVFPPQYITGQANQPLIPMPLVGNALPPYHPQNALPSYSSGPQSKSSGSVASSEHNQHFPLRVNRLASHPEVQEPAYLPSTGPAFIQDRRHGQMSAAVADQRQDLIRSSDPFIPSLNFHDGNANVESNIYQNTGESVEQNPVTQLRISRSNSGVRPDGQVPLSVYQESCKQIGNENTDAIPDLMVNEKPVLAPKPPNYSAPQGKEVTFSNSQERARSPLRENKNYPARPIPGDSIGVKARSCDSGLPNDDLDPDFESEGADSHRPLLTLKSALSPNRPTSKHLGEPSASSHTTAKL
ncbi:inactive tyrosine-protein kinase transmembrane receptor ROR1-like [Clavelina lepadiformis]|uniref:receptor protein-tyrosine kinase n=1 Tax=Clavelina lepadiformis TaxID=159417 RepID=A0ABP0F978_CLALP